MRLRSKGESGVSRVRPMRMERRAPLLAALLIVLISSLPVFARNGAGAGSSAASVAAPGDAALLTLTQALEAAARNHPVVWDAAAGALQTELAWERQLAQRRLQASVSTDLAGLVLDSGKDEGLTFASGLTLDRPVHVNANWTLAAGTTLSATGVMGDERGSGNVLSFSFNRQLWPSPELSGAERERQSALEALDETPLRTRQALASALIDVYRRYRALQVEEARLVLLAAEATVAFQRYEEIAAQHQRGLVSEDDVIRAEVERDRAQANLERAGRELALNLRGFLRDLGMDEHANYRLEPLEERSTFVPIQVDREEAAARALAASADVLAAQRNLRSAERRHEAAMKASKLSASLSVRTTLDEWDSSPVYSAFVVASYDLADGGSIEIERRDAEFNLIRAQRAFDSARAGVYAEIDRRLSDLEWLGEQVRLAERSLELAERAHKARVEQGRRGVVTDRAVEQSARELQEARLSLDEAIVNYDAARLELQSLMGEELEIGGF